VLPDASDKVLYVFYDFETMQNTRYSDKATTHVSKLVCVLKFCSQCEGAEDYGYCCDAVRGRTRSGTIRWGRCY